LARTARAVVLARARAHLDAGKRRRGQHDPDRFDGECGALPSHVRFSRRGAAPRSKIRTFGYTSVSDHYIITERVVWVTSYSTTRSRDVDSPDGDDARPSRRRRLTRRRRRASMFAATSLSSATRATCAIKVRGRARKVIDAGGGARTRARRTRRRRRRRRARGGGTRTRAMARGVTRARTRDDERRSRDGRRKLRSTTRARGVGGSREGWRAGGGQGEIVIFGKP
jgi:hypothetical protein